MPVDHYENFPVASILLPRRLRRPVETIYRFARQADDIADEGNAVDSERMRELDRLRGEIDRIGHGHSPVDPAFVELGTTISEWKLPIQLFRDLLDAFAQDITKKRYADHPELLDYCRRSANPIGRLIVYLIGCPSEENLRWSDSICTALQLTNFWQDIAIDWQKDRVYIPQTDLLRFGISEAHIASNTVNANWRALLETLVEDTRTLMISGTPLVHRLPGRMGWEIRLTIQGGLRILERIKHSGGDIFRHRPILGPVDWLRMSSRALFM